MLTIWDTFLKSEHPLLENAVNVASSWLNIISALVPECTTSSVFLEFNRSTELNEPNSGHLNCSQNLSTINYLKTPWTYCRSNKLRRGSCYPVIITWPMINILRNVPNVPNIPNVPNVPNETYELNVPNAPYVPYEPYEPNVPYVLNRPYVSILM